MQTAPVFIFWYNETAAYHIDKWIDDLHRLADTRRIGTDAETTKAQIDRGLRPAFAASWKQMAVSPLAFMDVGQAIAQATLVAYDEGLGTCCMSSPRLEQVGKLLNLPEYGRPGLPAGRRLLGRAVGGGRPDRQAPVRDDVLRGAARQAVRARSCRRRGAEAGGHDHGAGAAGVARGRACST